MSNNERDHIAAVGNRLSVMFPETPSETIDAAIAAEHARFEGRKIRDFVPLLVERNAKAALDPSRNT